MKTRTFPAALVALFVVGAPAAAQVVDPFRTLPPPRYQTEGARSLQRWVDRNRRLEWEREQQRQIEELIRRSR